MHRRFVLSSNFTTTVTLRIPIIIITKRFLEISSIANVRFGAEADIGVITR